MVLIQECSWEAHLTLKRPCELLNLACFQRVGAIFYLDASHFVAMMCLEGEYVNYWIWLLVWRVKLTITPTCHDCSLEKECLWMSCWTFLYWHLVKYRHLMLIHKFYAVISSMYLMLWFCSFMVQLCTVHDIIMIRGLTCVFTVVEIILWSLCCHLSLALTTLRTLLSLVYKTCKPYWDD